MNKSYLDDMNEILNFGARFSGRLDAEMLKGALNYVHFNEFPLAVDTLLEHLYEYSIPISVDEYNFALFLAEKHPFSEDSWDCLKEIIE